MRQNRDIFTRENYICFEGIAFEGVSHEKEGINWMHWKRKHENFDMLSNVTADKRNRKDKIDSKFYKSLAKELKHCEGLRTYANKFVAHASDSRNRTNLSEKQRKVTLQKLDDAYKAIIRIASFLGSIILYEHSLGGVPVPQFNQIENLDKPMIAKDDLSNLHSYWHIRTKEIDSWESDLWETFKA